ncbi:MAG TPA: T9SS type A sorting domain-containing protein [Rubricoccaceae bacterium]|jgi:hypothetical protein
MRLFATASLLALVLAAGPASAQQTSRTHNTGTAALRVFNNGYYGANVGIPAPTDTTFTFGGGSPLYEGQLLVAVSPTQISGAPYSDNPDGNSPGSGFNWTFGPRPAVVAAPAPFDRALQTTFTDAGTTNPDPAGITVLQRSYSRTGDDFVVVEVNVSSPVARTGVYIGMFADYDVSASATADRGAFDTATRTVYTFNAAATGGNRNYYGVSLLGRPQSGWNVTTLTDPAGLYTALSTNGTAATANADRRMVVGAGPFTLAANVPQQVRFAFVGGTNLADLTANAAAAQALFTAGAEGPVAAGLALLAPAPNPASTTATLPYTLDVAQTVRLAVYDVLGREVAVVAEGARSAGPHAPSVDVSSLAPGVYVARLTAGGVVLARRFSVVR